VAALDSAAITAAKIGKHEEDAVSSLQGKTVVILVAHEFEDIELYYPLLRLSEEGARIVVGTVPGGSHPRPYVPGKPITGRFGLTVPAPWLPEGSRYTMEAVSDLKVADIDAIVVPGGFCPDILRRDPTTVSLVRDAVAANKIVAAICHGPWLLYSADVVRGRKTTGFISLRDDAVHAESTWVDEPVVRDGVVITSRTPTDLPEFCQAIITGLQS
jgi:protease I